MIAAAHADTSKAVEMIDLLMQRGAVLESRDYAGQNVLLYACYQGVEWPVIECVMKWDASKGGGILKWSDCARSALILACVGGHTRLALNLLDEIDIEEYAIQNHPFHVLYAAIEFGDEPHALAIAGYTKIQIALGAANLDNYKRRAGILGLQEGYRITQCAMVATRLGMAEVLRLMDNLNHLKVSKATWYFIHNISRAKACSRHPAILDIAEQYAKDWRWEQVKLVFLLRERNVKTAGGKFGPHVLALLPDQLFRLVVEFIQSKEPPKLHSARRAL